MRRWIPNIALALVSLQLCGGLSAAPMTSYEAEMVVLGWLRFDPNPLGTPLGREILAVDTFIGDEGEAVYHVVQLQPAGFIIVSADDLVEPIIGFADDGEYNPSPTNALGTLVEADLRSRLAAARSPVVALSIAAQVAPTTAQKKWALLMDLALAPYNDLTVMSEPPLCSRSPSDLRVAPLTASAWGQMNVSSSEGANKACYNYYTPQWNASTNEIEWEEDRTDNYYSGCVATAMAQLMRAHSYPKEGIGVEPCDIKVVKYYDDQGN